MLNVLFTFRRFSTSPTFMTWASMAVRLGSWLVVLPLVLHVFVPADVALWLLFGTVFSLQIVGNAGFSQTFMRAIANAEGGASVAELGDLRAVSSHEDRIRSDPGVLRRVVSTLEPLYRRLAAFGFIVLASLGTVALYKSIEATADVPQAWMAWLLILLATTASIWGNSYVSYLLGRNRVALLRRWEMLYGLGSLASAAIVLTAGGHLLALVATQQAWTVASILRNRWLCRKDAVYRQAVGSVLDMEIVRVLWPAAWRSGLGILTSLGVVQASGLVYARLGAPVEVASYLLGLKVIQLISQLSQAPFYSKLPLLARLRAQGKHDAQIILARRGMLFAHGTFLTAFVLVGAMANPIIHVLGSTTRFVSPLMWTFFGLAFFVERAGAMHLQLYSTTNHIIWHVVNALTGVAMIGGSALLYPLLGIVAFPVAMLASYLFIYCPISYSHSYRAFGLRFRTFDIPVALGPLSLGAVAWISTTAQLAWR